MLQHQRIYEWLHRLQDRAAGYVQRGLALEFAALAARPDNLGQHGEQFVHMTLISRPPFRDRVRCHVVKSAIVEEQRQVRLNDCAREAAKPFARSSSALSRGPGRRGNYMMALRTNRLANGLLRLKKLVDVGLRKPDGLPQAGHRCLSVAVMGAVVVGCSV